MDLGGAVLMGCSLACALVSSSAVLHLLRSLDELVSLALYGKPFGCVLVRGGVR